MNFYRGNLKITREALFNYGWKKDHTEIAKVKWNSENKIVIIQDVEGQEYKIKWDDIIKFIPIDLPDVSKISYAFWSQEYEYIGIRFESNSEEKYLKDRQPDDRIYVMYVLK